MKTVIDEINENIYISDMSNYDLLMMNESTKRTFQISEDCIGKKCYHVLYNKSSPCEFCPRKYISNDKFYFWECHDKSNGRDFLIRDKIVEFADKLSHLQIALDISGNAFKKIQLQNTIEVNKITLDCAKKLFSVSSPENAMNYIVENVGEFLEAEISFILEFSDDKLKSKYVWERESSFLSKSVLSDIIIEKFVNEKERVSSYGYLDRNKLRESFPLLYDELLVSDIKAVSLTPIVLKGKLKGCMGTIGPKKNKDTVLMVYESLSYFIKAGLEKTNLSEMLNHFSYYDMLTNLGNRNKFVQDIELFSYKENNSVGIVYIDINSLKTINENYGHAKGDMVLYKASKIIKKAFNVKTIYRIGGDEFVVIYFGDSEELFIKKVKKLKNVFLLNADCSAAIGWKWSHTCTNLNEIVTQADNMMSMEKRKYYRYNPISKRYRHSTDGLMNMADKSYLTRLLNNGQFFVYLQPKVSFMTKELIGAEALIRYKDYQNNMVGPDQFIPILEESRLISSIDYFVLENICAKISEWISEGVPTVPISLNFSRYTILSENFIDKIKSIWEKYSIPKELIEIEITESVGEITGNDIIDIIHEIKREGFKVSIDDFGMKYSNMSLFSIIDFDILKIDKSLIDNVTNSIKTSILIKTLVSLCKSMDINMIVEGVETEEQFEILRNLNCYGAQGYYISRPIPMSDFETEFLKVDLILTTI